jgi:hypothetical protein
MAASEPDGGGVVSEVLLLDPELPVPWTAGALEGWPRELELGAFELQPARTASATAAAQPLSRRRRRSIGKAATSVIGRQIRPHDAGERRRAQVGPHRPGGAGYFAFVPVPAQVQ